MVATAWVRGWSRASGVRGALAVALLGGSLALAPLGLAQQPAAAAAGNPSPVPMQEFVADGAGGRLWNAYNQTVTAGGPNVLGDPSAVVVGSAVHVFGQAAGGDLVEYVNDGAAGRPWNAYDLTVAAGGIPLAGSPHAVTTPQGLVYIFARGVNGDLVEYVNAGAAGRIWSYGDLSLLAAGGGPVTGAPAPLFQPTLGVVEVYVAGPAGHLIDYESAVTGGWATTDVSAVSGGPAIGGTPSALFDDAQGIVHVYAQASFGDLVEYVNDNANGQAWHAYDLNGVAGGGPIASDPSALNFGLGSIHVYAENSVGDLVEYVNDSAYGRIWNVYDLSVAAAGSFIAGTPAAISLGASRRIHVYARAANNDLVEFVNDGSYGRLWNSYDLTSAAYGPSIGTNPSAVSFADIVHVYVGGPTSMAGRVVSNLTNIANFPYPPGARVVALSFDDGPSAYTSQVLNILSALRAPASFEIVGQQGAANVGILIREQQGGFGLVNHTWSHVDLRSLPPNGWPAQVDNTDGLLAGVTHRLPSCLRPPYGYTNPQVVSELAQRGLGEFMWDVDPSDYLRPGVSAITARVLGALHPGAVIVLHDGGGDRSQTVAALPSIINGIRAAGYMLVEGCG